MPPRRQNTPFGAVRNIMRSKLNRTRRQFWIVCSNANGGAHDIVLPYWLGWRFAQWRTRRLARRFPRVKLIYWSPVLRWDVVILESALSP